MVVPHPRAHLAVAADGLRGRQAAPDPPTRLPRATYKQVGYEIAGWFQFQPIFDRIFDDNPDIVD